MKQSQSKVHRSAGGNVMMHDHDETDALQVEESKTDDFANLKMDVFDEKTFLSKSTAMFSTFEPSYIFA